MNSDNSTLYRAVIMEHYRHPHNAKALFRPDQTGEAANSACGDIVKVALKWQKDTLQGISFQSQGCAVSVAAASVLSTLVKGKSPMQIRAVEVKDLLGELGITPNPSRLKCATLAYEELQRLVKEHG